MKFFGLYPVVGKCNVPDNVIYWPPKIPLFSEKTWAGLGSFDTKVMMQFLLQVVDGELCIVAQKDGDFSGEVYLRYRDKRFNNPLNFFDLIRVCDAANASKRISPTLFMSLVFWLCKGDEHSGALALEQVLQNKDWMADDISRQELDYYHLLLVQGLVEGVDLVESKARLASYIDLEETLKEMKRFGVMNKAEVLNIAEFVSETYDQIIWRFEGFLQTRQVIIQKAILSGFKWAYARGLYFDPKLAHFAHFNAMLWILLENDVDLETAQELVAEFLVDERGMGDSHANFFAGLGQFRIGYYNHYGWEVPVPADS